MPIPVRTLRVHPNPYIVGCIDHLGRPAGRVPYDPYEDSPRKAPDVGVGAKLAEVTKTHLASEMNFGGQLVVAADARYDHRISYSRDAVEIPNTPYYREAIRAGNLFAADKATFAAAGRAAADFVEPSKAIDAAKADAIGHFDASTGEGAHEEMGAFEPLYFGADDVSEPLAGSGPKTPNALAPVEPPAKMFASALSREQRAELNKAAAPLNPIDAPKGDS